MNLRHDPFEDLSPAEEEARFGSRGGRVIRPVPERKSRFMKASDLAGRPLPSRRWLVDDLVPGKTVTLLSGDGGTGKSLLALQLTVAVATSGFWLGRKVEPGRALFLSAEDDLDELHIRLHDVVRAEHAGLSDLDDLTIRSLAGEDALLAMLDGRGSALQQTALYDELNAVIEAEAPSLVVLDTSADLFGGDENNRPQVRQFIGLLKRLALQHDCAVILLSHPSLSGLNSGSGMSGSTAWNNSVRSRLYFERITGDQNEDIDPDARRLSTKKANYGPVGGEILVRWQEGVFQIEPGQSMTRLDKMAAGQKAERVFLKLLTAFDDQGRQVNHAGGSNYAPKLFAENPDSEGVKKLGFRKAMDALLAAGAIKIVTDGPPSRRVSHIEKA